MKTFFSRAITVASLGYILMYWSELLFWANFDPDSLAPFTIGSFIAYSTMAFVMLYLITTFRVRRLLALFLVGAIVGWLVEGVVAMTLFGAEGIPFPITISWTALAWHALISVLVGWYLVNKTLLQASYLKNVVLFSTIGLIYGLWSVFWWAEEAPATIEAFSIYSFIATLLLVVAHALYVKHTAPFVPSKSEKIFVALIILAYFFFITVPTIWYSLILIPLLILITYIPLWRNRKKETRDNAHIALTGTVPLGRLLCLFLIPLVATGVYVMATVYSLMLPTNLVLFFITVPLGFILYIKAFLKL